MKKIKICYMLVNPFYGGAVTVVSHLIRGLDKNKYEITLLYDSGYNEIDSVLNTIKKYPLKLIGKRSMISIFQIWKLFKRERFDIIHSHNIKTHVLGILIGYINRVPKKICTIHEDIIGILKIKKKNNFYVVLLYKIIFGLSDINICVSKSTLSRNHKLFTKKNVFVVRNGYECINSMEIKKNNNENNEIIISYIGRIAKEKGLHLLIEAIGELQLKYSVILQIVGGSYDDDYLKDINQKINQKKIRDIHFYGVVKNISQIISQTDIVVVPSLIESMGYSILDAWCCKKAVIASNIDGIPEVITPFKDGLLFKMNDLQDLVDKIEYLIKNPDQRKLLGETGFNKLQTHYSSKIFVKENEKFYDKYYLG